MKLQETFVDNRRRGVTLVEILVVVTIGFILVAATIPIYSDLQASAQIDESTSQLVQTIRTARERSNARLNGEEHGMYILQTAVQDSYVVYQGPSYAERNSAYDRVTSLDRSMNITTNFPGNDVHFSGGSGIPSTSGTITLTHDTEGFQTITVTDLGVVEQ